MGFHLVYLKTELREHCLPAWGLVTGLAITTWINMLVRTTSSKSTVYFIVLFFFIPPSTNQRSMRAEVPFSLVFPPVASFTTGVMPVLGSFNEFLAFRSDAGKPVAPLKFRVWRESEADGSLRTQLLRLNSSWLLYLTPRSGDEKEFHQSEAGVYKPVVGRD